MISAATIRQIALAFAETDEAPHQNVTCFRVKKKIFVTLNEPNRRACLRFSENDQYAFCSFTDSPFYPVPNKWGKQGWTLVDLEKADEEIIRDALTMAYCEVAPKKLAEIYLPDELKSADF